MQEADLKKYYLPEEVKGYELFIGPDGEYYDEEEIYESIKQADRARLIKFG